MSLAGVCACGDDSGDKSDEACSPVTSEGCEDGLVCEEIMGGEPACFAPVVVRGRILDLATGQGVEGATVVALDINGSARSSVSISEDDGEYAVTLPVMRTEDGEALADPVTLRVGAAGYQAFPTPPREALPIEITLDRAVEPEAGDAEQEDDEEASPAEHTVRNAATDVGLIALPGDRSGDAVIEGEVAIGDAAGGEGEDEGEADDAELEERDVRVAGALVAAVQGDRAVSTAIADLDGAFVLWNVPPGETRVEAYKAGLRAQPETVQAAAAERVTDVVLEADTDGLSRVSGSVNIVNAEGGLETSVILVLESTFDADVARGIAPAGLRASEVGGAFEILDVPPGRYAVLAAFENDRLVRDPDTSIAGTDIVYIDVASGADESLDESFKITEALRVIAPGADEPDVLPLDADPSFEWADDSSEDGYELRVLDAFGEVVHEALDVPRVTGSPSVSYTWENAPLSRGMIYQFRVVSYRDARNVDGGRAYISATEDLRGVFQAGMVDEQRTETP